MIETKWIKGTENLTDAFKIRTEVFIKEQNVPEELEMDELDQEADHIVGYIGGEAASTGRLIYVNGQYLLGRIAVLKKYRGQRLGDLIVRMLIRRAFDKGAQEVHIHAQTRVQEFYEKLGFVPYGEIYDEAGIPHINMIRKEDIKGGCC